MTDLGLGARLPAPVVVSELGLAALAELLVKFTCLPRIFGLVCIKVVS